MFNKSDESEHAVLFLSWSKSCQSFTVSMLLALDFT